MGSQFCLCVYHAVLWSVNLTWKILISPSPPFLYTMLPAHDMVIRISHTSSIHFSNMTNMTSYELVAVLSIS